MSEAELFLFDRYAEVDALAIYFRSWRRCTLIALFVLAFLAVASFEVYAHFLRDCWWVLLGYPVALKDVIATLPFCHFDRREKSPALLSRFLVAALLRNDTSVASLFEPHYC